MIQFQHVTKKFGNDIIAVDNVNFEINTGEFICVIGTSGSGKTTLMRMINKMETITDGRILLDGVDNNEIDSDKLRRKIGYVIQGIGLFPHMTIEENIMIVPRLLKWSKEKQHKTAVELIEKIGMDSSYLSRKPKELSGGQQQRIGVLRALAADQDIILMDEPFGALDPITRDSLQEMIKQLQQEMSKTIVFVTHDINEALRLADRIIVMDKGKIIQFGTPKEIIDEPENEFVAELVGKEHLKLLTSSTLVKEIMNRKVTSISIAHSLKDALKLMREARVDTLLVTDDDCVLKGYIGIGQFDTAAAKEKSVVDILRTDTQSVNENKQVKDVIYPLLNGKLKYIPVVDDENHLTGIITRTSLVDIIYNLVQD